MIEQGLVIMLIGMGTVFAFLVILVLAMIYSSKLVAALEKVFPEPVEQVARPSSGSGDNLAMVAAAIAVAKSQ